MRVKGRRSGDFIVKIDPQGISFNGLDGQDDLTDAAHAGNLAQDLQDALADERTSASPNEVNINILKEVVNRFREDTSNHVTSKQNDFFSQNNVNAASKPHDPFLK